MHVHVNTSERVRELLDQYFCGLLWLNNRKHLNIIRMHSNIVLNIMQAETWQ